MLEAPEVIVGLKADGDGLTTAITLAEPMVFVFPFETCFDMLPRTIQLTVPCGFVSNGASVPRFFWRLLSPPLDPVTLAPSIVHDWLYENGDCFGFTRRQCDIWYHEALFANGYPLWKCALTYIGIRLFGRSHWRVAT